MNPRPRPRNIPRPRNSRALLFPFLVVCLTVPTLAPVSRVSAEPVATGDVTGTVEVDLGDALKPLHQADADTNARIDTLEDGTPPDPVDPTDPTDPTDPDPGDPGGPGDPGAGAGGGYGVGLEPLTSYTTAWPLADLAMLTKWRDGVGWVIYEKGHPPAGEYVITWAGSGTLTLGGFTVTDTRPNRITARIPADARILTLKPSARDDVTNLRILPADWDGRTFNPLYLERLRGFKVLRFMDWQRTNNAGPRTWSTRVMPGDNQTTDGGAAIETIVELCNELKADPWLCIPHRAEPHYVRTLAEYCRDNLHPGATVYVEWSNEVWNDQFSQGQWLADVADTTRRSDAWFARWASEARQDFEAFGDALGPDRVVRVLGVQLQNVWIAQKLVANMPAGSFDALAPSAYFGFTRTQMQNMPAGVNADELAAILERNIATDNAHWYGQHALIARAYRVRLIAYEGGTHAQPVGVRLPYNDALRTLNYSPRMIDLYRQNHRAFEDAGGDLIAAYHFTGGWDDNWGGFGHLEYQDQPISDAPKFRAITTEPETPE
jgi:hypothetical protein